MFSFVVFIFFLIKNQPIMIVDVNKKGEFNFKQADDILNKIETRKNN